MSATGLPDAPTPPDPSPLPNPRDEWIEGTVPSLWQAQAMSARALTAMQDAEEGVKRAHDEHAEVEEEYRRAKFTKGMEARDVEHGGKKLTDRERGLWLDAELAPLKRRMRAAWGVVEAARGALTRADREQATVRAYTEWARREQTASR